MRKADRQGLIDHFGAPWVARDRYQLREDARRFETWENSYALRAGLGAALDYADKIGIDAIEERVSHLASFCRELLGRQDKIELRDIGDHRCGIISFTVEGVDPAKVITEMGKAGFVIGGSPASSTRLDAERRGLPTVLRIAPHLVRSCAQRSIKLSEATTNSGLVRNLRIRSQHTSWRAHPCLLWGAFRDCLAPNDGERAFAD